MADASAAVGLPLQFGVRLFGQAAVTVVVVAVVVGVRVLVGQWRGYTDHDVDGSRVAIAVTGAVAALTVGGAVVLVDVWNLYGPIRTAILSPEEAGRGTQGTQQLILAGVLVAGAYGVTNFLGRIVEEASTLAGVVDRHQRRALYRTTQVVVYSFVSLITLGLFVRDLGGLLVGAGFLGIVVGMAARQTLGSVLAGFVLMFSRPFEIGDWVTIGGHDGVVADISIVHTHLRTADGEHVHLPNDVVESESLVNRSREGRLRLEVDVGIDYDADVDRAVEVARRAAEECDAVVDAPDPGVVVKEFGGSAVTLGVRAWVDDPSAERFWAARTALVSAIKRAFDAEGVGIPFPQRTVTVASDDDVDAGGGSAAEVATADGGGVERGSSAGEGS